MRTSWDRAILGVTGEPHNTAMKIAFTTHQFLPEYSSGTEILTLTTAEELKGRGHTVHVFTGYPLKQPGLGIQPFDYYEYKGIPTDRFFFCKRYSLWNQNPMEAEYNNPFFGEHFRHRIQDIKPDLVHCYHLQGLSAAVVSVCKEVGIPVVFTATDFWLICPTNQLLLPDFCLCSGPDKDAVNCLRHLAALSGGDGLMPTTLHLLPHCLLATLMRFSGHRLWPEKRFGPLLRSLSQRSTYMRERLNQMDRVLVPTRFMRDTLLLFGMAPERLFELPFGIDHSHISPVLPKGGETNLRVGFIGTLYHHKGAHVLLEAIRLLPRNLPLTLKVYGSLGQFPQYVEQLASLAGGDERITFCGTFPYSQIGYVLEKLDVLVVPSLWYENAPLVVYSALAAKVPVLASDTGGISEIVVPNKNGLLFERGNAQGLADLIHRLCQDRDLVRGLSNGARKPCSVSSYVDELERIYYSLSGSQTAF